MKKKLCDLIRNNKNLFISVLTVVGIIVSIVLVCTLFFDKKTFAIDPTADNISINCPETAKGGDEIVCSITLSSKSIITQGISARHGSTEGMKFISFSPESEWNVYGNDADGFLLVNFDGFSGSNLIGTVKYTVPSTASSNEKYKVELVYAEIGDGQDVTISFNNVYDEIRILSDINTLDNITLSAGSLDGTFNKGNSIHSATVNSDKVTIGATKTDANSTVSGDIGEAQLHYGTNTFNIVVTSETGKKNTYVLNIYRPYEFSSDIYVYSKKYNYIYTGTDVDSDSILSNVVLPGELISNIENNKLYISNDDENLLEINVFNISSSKYIISDDVIYIDSNLTYDNFINSINLNGVSANAFDTNGNKVTSGIILEGYTFKVYYGNDLLDEYTIKEEYLNIENLNIDKDNNVIKGIKVNTTCDSILSNITTTGTVRIVDTNGKELSDTDIVKTYDIIEIIFGGNTYRYNISVIGDISGDGRIDVNDVVKMAKNMIKDNVINDYTYKYASDINSDNKVDINDVIKLAKHIIKKTEI